MLPLRLSSSPLCNADASRGGSSAGRRGAPFDNGGACRPLCSSPLAQPRTVLYQDVIDVAPRSADPWPSCPLAPAITPALPAPSSHPERQSDVCQPFGPGIPGLLPTPLLRGSSSAAALSRFDGYSRITQPPLRHEKRRKNRSPTTSGPRHLAQSWCSEVPALEVLHALMAGTLTNVTHLTRSGSAPAGPRRGTRRLDISPMDPAGR